MVGRIDQLKAQLFQRQTFVAGGHGARRPAHGTMTLPKGITLYFYVRDTESLPNSVGQKVDKILAGGAAPAPVAVLRGGSYCWNYHLYSPRNGGYLSLASSSKADSHYITTDDSANGISLKSICETIVRACPVADLHWSACRSTEADGDVFPDTLTPTYPPGSALANLAAKAGKIA